MGTSNNLPVLYTVPKWNLVRGTGCNSTYYYVPTMNKWINNKHLRRELSTIGMTIQEYYDRWFLNITVPSDRPKCPCGNSVAFFNASKGYRDHCSNKCSATYISDETRENMSKAQRINQNRIEVREKQILSHLGHQDSEETRRKKSESHKGKIPWNLGVKASEETRKKLSERRKGKKNALGCKHTPEMNHQKSLRSKAAHADPNKYVNGNSGASNFVRGIREKVTSVYTGEEMILDSRFESRFYRICIEDPTVVRLIRADRFCRIPYTLYGESHTYKPDFLIFREGSEIPELVEVKPDYQMDYDIVIAKRLAAIEYCKKNHLIHYTVTEKYLNSLDESMIYYHVLPEDFLIFNDDLSTPHFYN